MNVVRLLPVILSFLLIGAHFQRAGWPLLGILCLLAPGLLYFTRPWAARILQLLLICASLEWVHTLITLVGLRQEYGMPFVRLAVILGAVATFSALSAVVFQLPALKGKYHL